jgi:hypothetical protein
VFRTFGGVGFPHPYFLSEAAFLKSPPQSLFPIDKLRELHQIFALVFDERQQLSGIELEIELRGRHVLLVGLAEHLGDLWQLGDAVGSDL